MKPSSNRRFRRRAAPSRDAGTFKKDAQEQSFFGAPAPEPFFQTANSVQRKELAGKEEEKMQRVADKKEEEKVKRKEDKKEEEKIQRSPEKKEEEKVKRKEDKKEEEKVQRATDKKEEEKVQRAPDKKEEEKVQRKENTSVTSEGGKTASYISSINGKGQPMPASLQSFYKQRMGSDFSDVMIHTGKDAEDSAKDVNAKAYTYGNNIVFNEGQYNTTSTEGKKLLAHELTHVVQQKGASAGNVQRDVNDLPNVSQGDFDSCGAASIVAAIMIHDQQLSTTVPNNSGFVAAANVVLSYYTMHQTSIITGLETRRRITHEQADALYWDIRALLLQIREDSRQLGVTITQADYQHLSVAIYALYVANTVGLSQAAIGNITNMLGMTMTSEGGLESYSSIISHPSLVGLASGQIAQIGWYVRTGGTGVGMHAFLIGRLNNGTWYLYDQGPNPPVRFTAPSLGELDGIIRAAAATGSYWLFTGSTSEFRVRLIGGWTGINILGDASGVLGASTNLLTAGTRLAEIDEGTFTIGSDVNVVGFHSEYYDLPSAQAAASGLSGSGGAIIEMPKDRFLLYTTSQVSDANRTQTAIDAADGGEFTQRRFFHAWLQLRSSSGIGSFFSVY